MFKIRNFVLTVLTFVICNAQANAVVLPQAMRDTMATNTVGMPSLLNLVISMIVVIAMIYVTGFIYGKLNIVSRSKLNALTGADKEKHRFTVLQSMPLGQQRHIYSIEMDGKIFLVGSTPNQISLIKEFEQNMPDFDIKKELFQEDSGEKINSVDFDELYKKYKK